MLKGYLKLGGREKAEAGKAVLYVQVLKNNWKTLFSLILFFLYGTILTSGLAE